MISTLPPRDHFRADGSVALERLSSAGRPAPLVTVAIMDEDGTLLPRGERGEIVVRSSLVMAGYYHNPEATAEASAHGWHHTGDIGYLDDDNFLYIVDRAKDMIITGGFNVYSTEVEQALMAAPGRPGLRGDRPARREVGRAGDRRGPAARGPSRSTRTSSRRSSRSGSAASRRPSRSRSGRTCRARRSARCSRATSAPRCWMARPGARGLDSRQAFPGHWSGFVWTSRQDETTCVVRDAQPPAGWGPISPQRSPPRRLRPGPAASAPRSSPGRPRRPRSSTPRSSR